MTDARWNPDEYVASYKDAYQMIELFFPQIIKETNLVPYANVLELGTGSGKWAIAYAMYGCNVVAVDNEPKMLERVSLNFPILSRCVLLNLNDATSLVGIPNRLFDIVSSEGLYEHFLDPDIRKKTARLWYDKIKPLGYCVIMVPLNNVADDEITFKKAEDLAEEIDELKLYDKIAHITFKYANNKGLIMVCARKNESGLA